MIDFSGFSGETLHGVVQEPLDKIRTGQLKPASVSIRMPLPDTTRPMTVPFRVGHKIPFPGGDLPIYDLWRDTPLPCCGRAPDVIRAR